MAAKCFFQDLFADAYPTIGGTDIFLPSRNGVNILIQEAVPLGSLLTCDVKQGSTCNSLNDSGLDPVDQ